MHAIGGFFHLDARPANPAAWPRMRAALVPCAHGMRPRFDGVTTGAVALGTATWGGHETALNPAPVFRDAESGCMAVADARLDERAELAARLGLDRAAPAPGPVELIVRAWLRWGEQCPEYLHGDFAFAVWDPRQQRLFCARDIMGVRPLYVHHRSGKLFAFASRAQALLVLPGVPRDLNEARIADALVAPLEGVDKRCTFYRAVQRLPPAHCLGITLVGHHERQYWRLQPGLIALPTTDTQWAEGLTEVLERAVARHLDGDAKVGCMVSGGMDSSSLAVIAAQQLAAAGRELLATFSSVSDDPACPETQAIEAMLALPGFVPTRMDPAMIDACRAVLVEATQQSDEPFDAMMVLLHVQYLAAAQGGVDALMDGVDGDMLFASGGVLIRQLRNGQWLDFWRNMRGYRRLYPQDNRWRDSLHDLVQLCRSAFVPELARSLVHRLQPRDRLQEVLASSLIRADFASRCHLRERLQRHAAWRPSRLPDTAPEQAAWGLVHPATTCGLERYHRVAAWHGVDPRHPLADRQVLEFCVNLPDRQRLADAHTKIVLRRAMRGRLPASVCWRTDKRHLGWAMVRRLLIGDRSAVRRQLHEQRFVLEPYVDLSRLDATLRRWVATDRHEDAVTLFEVMSLGHWLQDHAALAASKDACHPPDD